MKKNCVNLAFCFAQAFGEEIRPWMGTDDADMRIHESDPHGPKGIRAICEIRG